MQNVCRRVFDTCDVFKCYGNERKKDFRSSFSRLLTRWTFLLVSSSLPVTDQFFLLLPSSYFCRFSPFLLFSLCALSLSLSLSSSWSFLSFVFASSLSPYPSFFLTSSSSIAWNCTRTWPLIQTPTVTQREPRPTSTSPPPTQWPSLWLNWYRRNSLLLLLVFLFILLPNCPTWLPLLPLFHLLPPLPYSPPLLLLTITTPPTPLSQGLEEKILFSPNLDP